jgi:radical SAM superfamily enzyme YgiQ (UPF0313 family)
VKTLLLSTYDLGRQPFGLASPAAWLARAGDIVTTNDLAVEPLDEAAARAADLIAIHVPMHTATRLAARAIPRVRALNACAHLACFGLYAPMNVEYLRGLGVDSVVGGEFEEGLAAIAEAIRKGSAGRGRTGEPLLPPTISLARQRFLVPDRHGLPPLGRYARLRLPDGSLRVVGSTEASRGCKHLCRHCPIVPVYEGHFRVVDRDVVLEDVRRQVAAGAEHITFGDPDFWNGPRHAMAIVHALHAEFPRLTFDVTIKVEHLLAHAEILPALRDAGCLFVTTAVESIDDAILARLDKGHTSADFDRVVALFREVGLCLAPTFVPFTPWTTLDGYAALLDRIAALDLVENVASVQLAIRLLIPAGSRLLELADSGGGRDRDRTLAGALRGFDEAALSWRWKHPDPRVDRLAGDAWQAVCAGERAGAARAAIFATVRSLAADAARGAHDDAGAADAVRPTGLAAPRAPVPFLTEPWFC